MCRDFDCYLCDISLHRKQIVYGDGNIKSKMLIIGEAPGGTENTKGKPFVGPSGKLLTEVLESFNFVRDKHYYITNVIKCRPPGNRVPYQYEIDNCLPHLAEEIHTMHPIIIVTLGKTAFSTVIGDPRPSLTKNRGKLFIYHNAFLVPMYHPAHLIRISDASTYAEDWALVKLLYKTFINPLI